MKTLKEKIIEILKKCQVEDIGGVTQRWGRISSKYAKQIIALFEKEKLPTFLVANGNKIGEWEEKPQENWEEEFDEKFCHEGYVEVERDAAWDGESIKSFIRQLLKSRDQEYKEKIKKAIPEEFSDLSDLSFRFGFNKCRSQLLDNLKDLLN